MSICLLGISTYAYLGILLDYLSVYQLIMFSDKNHTALDGPIDRWTQESADR